MTSKIGGAFLLVSLLLTIFLIGVYLAKEGEKGGPLDQGTEAVDQSKEIKVFLDTKAAEQNSVINQLP